MTHGTHDGLLPSGHMASGCPRTDYVASASSRSHVPAGSSPENEYELIELKYELLYTKKEIFVIQLDPILFFRSTTWQ